MHTRRRRGVLREGGTDPVTHLDALISFIRNDQDGQGLAEYGLILTLIAMVAVIALIFMGGQVSTMLDTVGQSV
jgi:pilus assembly protein Flp/PilA